MIFELGMIIVVVGDIQQCSDKDKIYNINVVCKIMY